MLGKNKNSEDAWVASAFIQIKNALVAVPILSASNFSEHFMLQREASSVIIRCIFTQKLNDVEQIIPYATRYLSRSERHYSR